METTPFDIELVRQKSGDSCVKACVQMVLNYYGFVYKKKDIKAKIHTYKKHSGLKGAYLPDVGVYLLKMGFKPYISHYDWGWWGEDQEEAADDGKRQLIRSLDELKQKKGWAKQRIVDKEIKFLEKGGLIKFTMPSKLNIDSHLMKKIPPLLLVQTEYFYHKPGKAANHSILIIGKKGGTYIIRDPLYAVDKINEDELYYAWAKSGGWMLTLPPKETRRSKQEQLGF